MDEKAKKFKINFNDGKSSFIDENTLKYIINLQNALKNQIFIPKFYDLTKSLNKYNQELLDFYSFIFKNREISHSQLFQDLFVLFKLGNKRKGRFLEFGATNGKELSNSYLLEKNFEWEGVLAEPSPQWEKSLKENRPRTKIINECIYSESGKMIDFFVSKNGDFSTINEFKESDIETMPGNTKARNEEGFTVKVPTISLNDVFIKHFNGEKIDYMSVDTEGSELLILSKFNFEKYGPKIVTVEHNFTSAQKNLDNLFEENNYKRFFPQQTQFDSWYIRN